MNTKQTYKLILIALSLFLMPSLWAQTPSIIQKIRIPIWAQLDAYPELADAQNMEQGEYDYPVKSIREVGPFLISGMVYGWKFSYTPSDKLRGVEEYLEIEEIIDFSFASIMLSYKLPSTVFCMFDAKS